MNLLVMGAGAMGTSLAETFCNKNKVDLWTRRPAQYEELNKTRVNTTYLPELEINSNINIITGNITFNKYNAVILCIPTQFIRSTLSSFNIESWNIPILNTAKGMELKTFLTPCEILRDIGACDDNLYALSGPSHAEEVAKGIPTTVVLAGKKNDQINNILQALSTQTFRPYFNHDRLGVELGGALKNIIAIAAGAALGLGFGMNTLSAIITRGISEITRYGTYRKTNLKTYYGLSCLGDLITTCCSDYSRNREFGRSLVNSNMHYTKLAEGAKTVESLIEQVSQLDFDMPLCQSVYEIAIKKKDVKSVMNQLISRPLKEED